MKRINADKKSVKNLPQVPGVYIFRDSEGMPVYVGKAINLRSRVSSYYLKNLATKTRQMVRSADHIRYIPVTSEIEALLLEASLVKRWQPKYNSELRDDKSPLYIGITKEKYPRILTLRQTQLDKYNLGNIYGPFVSAAAPRKVLRMLRRVFPYSTHAPGKRPCVYSEIGLCSPCPSAIENEEVKDKKEILRSKYKKNIANIKKVLSGKLKGLQRQLEKEMKEYSNKEEFEEASEVANQLKALEYITTAPKGRFESPYLSNPNLNEDIRERELQQLSKIVNKLLRLELNIRRIECFDIAHLSGTYPTASMVTFVDGEPDKTLYRHYRVSKQKKNDDVSSMKSVLIRRKASFKKWGKPDLVIVDGGKGQVGVANEVLGDEVAVVGLAKRFETFVYMAEGEYKEFRLPQGSAKSLVQRLRNEAHRFARKYHHNLVSKAIREANG